MFGRQEKVESEKGEDVTSAEEKGFLEAIKENPGDVTTLLAYADWLEEHDRPYRAMTQRVQAGVSQVRYKVRRRSDGLFAGSGEYIEWSAEGKEWERLSSVRGHLAANSYRDKYGGVPWDDVEIAVFEIRVQSVGALTFTITGEGGTGYGGHGHYKKRKTVTIVEPD
jgi:uncharacterized protein (TIGR02996 family)